MRALAAALALFVAVPAAADTITRYPSSFSDTGNRPITSPLSATVQDGVVATAQAFNDGTTQWTAQGSYTGFGIQNFVPVGSTVTSVTVTLVWYQNSTTTTGTNLQSIRAFRGGVFDTTNFATRSTTAVTQTFTLGASFNDPGMLQDGTFGVQWNTNNTASLIREYYLDSLSVTVTFTPPQGDSTVVNVN